MGDLPLANPENVTLATFYLDKEANHCGCPVICPGKQQEFRDVQFFPTSLEQVGIDEEVRDLLDDIERIYRKTGFPMCPCVAMHFIIPFSPACFACYFQSKQKRKLREVVEKFNDEKAAYRGIFAEWNQDYFAQYQPRPRFRNRRGENIVLAPEPKPALNILMNVPERQKFCYQNNIQFFIPGAQAPVAAPVVAPAPYVQPVAPVAAPYAAPPVAAPYAAPPVAAPYAAPPVAAPYAAPPVAAPYAAPPVAAPPVAAHAYAAGPAPVAQPAVAPYAAPPPLATGAGGTEGLPVGAGYPVGHPMYRPSRKKSGSGSDSD